MPFFSELLGSPDESEVAVVLTWRNLVNVKEMLGSLPFRDAHPLYQALVDLATAQQISGLRDFVQEALEKHSEREAFIAIPVPDGPPN